MYVYAGRFSTHRLLSRVHQVRRLFHAAQSRSVIVPLIVDGIIINHCLDPEAASGLVSIQDKALRTDLLCYLGMLQFVIVRVSLHLGFMLSAYLAYFTRQTGHLDCSWGGILYIARR